VVLVHGAFADGSSWNGVSDCKRKVSRSRLPRIPCAGSPSTPLTSLGTPENEHVPTDAHKRFYEEAGALADQLATAGYPTCAHHLLETLEFFIDVDPRGAFLRIAATIRGGQRFGYQYDTLAPALFVRIVERYLAEHRSLLQQDAECSAALVDMLDIFVRAGWPEARRLTYGLDEIYR